MSSPLQLTTAQLAGMVNALRKVLYFTTEALSPDQKRVVLAKVRAETTELENTSRLQEAFTETETLRSFLRLLGGR